MEIMGKKGESGDSGEERGEWGRVGKKGESGDSGEGRGEWGIVGKKGARVGIAGKEGENGNDGHNAPCPSQSTRGRLKVIDEAIIKSLHVLLKVFVVV